MKKLVLVLSATFSSISAFANEDFASNEIANDEIVAQTFASDATGEIAALSNEEMQNTKGAFSVMNGLGATLAVGSAGLGGYMGGTLIYNRLPGQIQNELGQGLYQGKNGLNDIWDWAEGRASNAVDIYNKIKK